MTCGQKQLWRGGTGKLSRPQGIGRSAVHVCAGVMEAGGQRWALCPCIICQEPQESEQSLQLLYWPLFQVTHKQCHRCSGNLSQPSLSPAALSTPQAGCRPLAIGLILSITPSNGKANRVAWTDPPCCHHGTQASGWLFTPHQLTCPSWVAMVTDCSPQRA